MSDRTQLGLARIERETVQERVYGVLRDRLMRGGFEPGQKLKIAELASALVKLHRDNASTLTPDTLYAAFYYSHPPPLARITRLRAG